jgi:hypothetical protein
VLLPVNRPTADALFIDTQYIKLTGSAQLLHIIKPIPVFIKAAGSNPNKSHSGEKVIKNGTPLYILITMKKISSS